MDMVTDSVIRDAVNARQEMRRVLALQQKAFISDMNPSKRVRLDRLDRMLKITTKFAAEIAAVISADFGNRSVHQTVLADTLMVELAIKHAKHHVGRWMRSRRAPTALHFQPGQNRIMRQPLGVVGIISPWNYPYQLAMSPAVGAIAAGNRVMIKPSELTPKFAALLQRLVAAEFAEDEMHVITGDAMIGKGFSELPFDHLLFTGSTQVGRLVAQVAAKNLTPVTLELGGKSPVIMDASADFPLLVTRVAQGKLFNGGQTCVAPDYVLVPNGRQDEFVAAFRAAVCQAYPKIADNPDYTSIINDRHFARLQGLVDDARAKGAKIVELNPAGEALDPQRRKFVPTLVLNATADMQVLREEIFGPVLPIIGYATLDDAISYVNQRDRPLALYWMGSDTKSRDKVLKNTISGGVTVNDCLLHFAQEDVPTGGVGPSGMGAYHGEYGFRTFSKEKPVFYQSKLNGVGLLFPPYGKTFEFVASVLQKIN